MLCRVKGIASSLLFGEFSSVRALLVLFLISSIACGEAFDLKTVIHPVVQKLVKPKIAPEFVANALAISTSSQKASDHVLAGLTQLNAPWDFEAYRHFAAAAEEDPDCLMAYWGISMSLAGLNHEFYGERKAAVERMLDLLEAGSGVEWEKGFAQAAGHLYTNGVGTSAEIYGKIAEKYPNNIQAKLFSLFLPRDGYSETGRPGVKQKKCIEGLEKLVKSNPENVMVISAWVMVHAEAPLNPLTMRTDVLPFARKLARLHPSYPPFQLIASHVEARCGNAELGIGYAREAIKYYKAYQELDEVSIYDCPGLVKAQVYLASLLAGKDKYEEAHQIADALAKQKVEEERLFSRGGSMLLWEARSLGPRIALAKGQVADLDHGLELLKVFNDEEWFEKQSFSVSYRNALAFCIGVRKALLKKDYAIADGLYRDLIKRVQVIDAEAALARKTSSYAEWLRGRNTIEVFAVELRGMLAMRETGAMKRAALTWFKSASDRQSRSPNLLPPAILYPLENRVGEYYLSVDDSENGAKAYREGLERMPNHLGSLRGYRSALLKLGKNDTAKKIAERIELVKK